LIASEVAIVEGQFVSTPTVNPEEYAYHDSAAECSHMYLVPTIHGIIRKNPSIHLHTDVILLDMGCGNGSMMSNFSGGGWNLIGTDFSESGILIARNHYEAIKNMKFVRSDISDLSKPLPDELAAVVGKVDIILSTEVIEHVYNPRGFIANAYRMLKPGAQLIISTPYHGYLKNLMLAVTGQMDKHFTVLWDHGHIKFWSRKTLTRALEETGFRNVEFYGAGRAPYLWKSMVLSCYK
jgi:2-polyprenyl-6-hydroxyphenyl methylase/3-demethylubiquinone-9 3-methyltransferase